MTVWKWIPERQECNSYNSAEGTGRPKVSLFVCTHKICTFLQRLQELAETLLKIFLVLYKFYWNSSNILFQHNESSVVNIWRRMRRMKRRQLANFRLNGGRNWIRGCRLRGQCDLQKYGKNMETRHAWRNLQEQRHCHLKAFGAF